MTVPAASSIPATCTFIDDVPAPPYAHSQLRLRYLLIPQRCGDRWNSPCNYCVFLGQRCEGQEMDDVLWLPCGDVNRNREDGHLLLLDDSARFSLGVSTTACRSLLLHCCSRSGCCSRELLPAHTEPPRAQPSAAWSENGNGASSLPLPSSAQHSQLEPRRPETRVRAREPASRRGREGARERMSEGVEDSTAGLCAPPGLASPAGTERALEEEPATAGGDEESGAGDGEAGGGGCPLGLAALAGACCVCLEREQVRSCLRSEKICILPILACLLSLALCTAGLKWVFVDKIFEYEPPTHLDPKRMGQDPVIVADPTPGLPDFLPRPSAPYTPSLTTKRPEVFVEGGDPTTGPFEPPSPRGTPHSPTSALTFRTDPPAPPGTPTPQPKKKEPSTVPPEPTLESNDIYIPKYSNCHLITRQTQVTAGCQAP
ncbi:hypothetical protein COCON_G00168980 [Conger conger]|uniref:Uncharacterized protein n=1 Tax=Conger conger TaxID=82655 RepID=A0A9Q1D7N5_CONCO|nr:hypothetical protein COCON_G00168980 [Conger conger]